MTSQLEGEYEVLRRHLVKTGYPDSVPREQILRGDTHPLLPLIYFAVCQFSPLLDRHISEDLGYDLKGLSDREFVHRIYSMMREEFSYVPRLKQEVFLTTANFAWLKLCFVNRIFDLMRSKHNVLRKRQRISRRQKSTKWSETTLSKRVTATIASHRKSQVQQKRQASSKNARTQRRRRSEARERRTKRTMRQDRNASNSPVRSRHRHRRSPHRTRTMGIPSSSSQSSAVRPRRTPILTDQVMQRVPDLRQSVHRVHSEEDDNDDSEHSESSSTISGSKERRRRVESDEDQGSMDSESDSDEEEDSMEDTDESSDSESGSEEDFKEDGIKDLSIDLHESSDFEEEDDEDDDDDAGDDDQDVMHDREQSTDVMESLPRMNHNDLNKPICNGDSSDYHKEEESSSTMATMSNRQPYNPQGYENDDSNATEEILNPAMNPFFNAPPPSSSDGNSSAELSSTLVSARSETTPAKSAGAKLPTIDEEIAEDSSRAVSAAAVAAESNSQEYSAIERTHVAIVAALVKQVTSLERAFRTQNDNLNARLILIESRMSAMEAKMDANIPIIDRRMHDNQSELASDNRPLSTVASIPADSAAAAVIASSHLIPQYSAPPVLSFSENDDNKDREDEKAEDKQIPPTSTSSAPPSGSAHRLLSPLLINHPLNRRPLQINPGAVPVSSSVAAAAAALSNPWQQQFQVPPSSMEPRSPSTVPMNENATIGSPLPDCSLSSKSKPSQSAGVPPSSSSSGVPSGLPDVPDPRAAISARIDRHLRPTVLPHASMLHASGSVRLSSSPSLLKYPVTSSSDGTGMGVPSTSPSTGLNSSSVPRILSMSDVRLIDSNNILDSAQPPPVNQSVSQRVPVYQHHQSAVVPPPPVHIGAGAAASSQSSSSKSFAPFGNPFFVGGVGMSDSTPPAAIYQSIPIYEEGKPGITASSAAVGATSVAAQSGPQSSPFDLDSFVVTMGQKISNADDVLRSTPT